MDEPRAGTNTYERPAVQDYGTLTDMTAATGMEGAEDGSTKTVSISACVSTACFP